MRKNDILMIHGTDYKEMAKRLLKEAGLAAMIGDRTKTIGLKPNLVTAQDPSNGATTHTELVIGTIEYLRAHGFYQITIMEGSWVGDRTDRAFKLLGYDKIAETYGVALVDLQKDSFKQYDAAGMKLSVCDAAANVDVMINMPVLKGHCQTTVTCALKNNKGVIPDSEKRRFHTMGLHQPIAHLNTVTRNDFILVDNICGDLDFEEGGNPVVMNRILGFLDPVLCDAFVCECMGYEPEAVDYIRIARQLGVGSTDLANANRVLLNEAGQVHGNISMTRRIRRLAAYTSPKDACSACYGSLIHALSRLDERGLLHKGVPPIAIGQGYRGEPGAIGIGRCTGCFEKTLPGCPPQGAEIVAFLERELSDIAVARNHIPVPPE